MWQKNVVHETILETQFLHLQVTWHDTRYIRNIIRLETVEKFHIHIKTLLHKWGGVAYKSCGKYYTKIIINSPNQRKPEKI